MKGGKEREREERGETHEYASKRRCQCETAAMKVRVRIRDTARAHSEIVPCKYKRARLIGIRSSPESGEKAGLTLADLSSRKEASCRRVAHRNLAYRDEVGGGEGRSGQ